jgi:hypothetical protein
MANKDTVMSMISAITVWPIYGELKKQLKAVSNTKQRQIKNCHLSEYCLVANKFTVKFCEAN